MAIYCAKKLSVKQFQAVEWRDPHRLTAGQVHHRNPVWSADGHWLCSLCGDGAEAVWLVSNHKGRPAQVLAGPATGGASFAADPSLVLALSYGRQVGASQEIWQSSAGATRPRRLLGGDGVIYRDPAYSPCGRFLAFSAMATDHPARLHLLDLRSGARLALPVGSERPELAAADLGRPAWSPAADRLFFEVTRGEEVAVYQHELHSQRTTRLTPEGGRQRRPAPLSPELLIVERDREDGSSDLVLLHLDAAGAVLRSRRLTARARCAREPAVVFRKGAAFLCCAMLCRPGDGRGDVQRYDLYVGRLLGVPAVALDDVGAAPEAPADAQL